MSSASAPKPVSGLQPQRTALAWTRTALTCAALAGALVKVAADARRGIDFACAGVALLAAVIVFACGRTRSGHEANPTGAPRALFLLTAGCAVVGNVVSVVVLVGNA